MICLILSSASQLALIGKLQARAKLSASEYENKESNNHAIRPNWSSFKEAPNRNPHMGQQP